MKQQPDRRTFIKSIAAGAAAAGTSASAFAARSGDSNEMSRKQPLQSTTRAQAGRIFFSPKWGMVDRGPDATVLDKFK
ncbi:MAG: twin-arginine translocation signal domain-containing protein, partial [Phycisphaerales bacterium]